MKSALADLQRTIEKHQKAGPFRYPPELRHAIVETAESLRRDGLSLTAVSEELSLPYETVRRWTAKYPKAVAQPALRRVEVVDAKPHGSLTLVSPNGMRIEGASVDEIVALVRALG